jgi:hypothetical protein
VNARVPENKGKKRFNKKDSRKLVQDTPPKASLLSPRNEDGAE